MKNKVYKETNSIFINTKMVELKLLSKNQKEEAEKLIRFYKYIFVCNHCGRVYGADIIDKTNQCPNCVMTSKEVKEKW